MKKLLVLIFMLLAVNLYAANLINKDSKKYSLEVKTVEQQALDCIEYNRIRRAPDGSTIKIKRTGSEIKVNAAKT